MKRNLSFNPSMQRMSFKKIGENLVKQKSNFNIQPTELDGANHNRSMRDKQHKLDEKKEPDNAYQVGSYNPKGEPRFSNSLSKHHSLNMKSSFSKESFRQSSPFLKYNFKLPNTYSNLPTTRYIQPLQPSISSESGRGTLESFKARADNLKFKFKSFKATENLTYSFDVQAAIRKSESSKTSKIHRKISLYYLDLFHPLLEEMLANQKINLNFLESGLKKSQIGKRVVEFEKYLERVLEILENALEKFPETTEIIQILEGEMSIPQKFCTKFELNRIHTIGDKIINLSQVQKQMIIGYLIIVKNLTQRIFLSLEDCGLSLSTPYLLKVNMKYIASILYLVFKEQISLLASTIKYDRNKDEFSHLYFGQDLVNALEEHSPKLYLTTQKRLFRYLDNINELLSERPAERSNLPQL
ncbi:unnamed protein product [Moneuplotes crassus]|uniref:Uncharacterized protein n=1 Tax=Euplotes crassus TaxID=5936 RepID=A0AAD1X912_EUPCR|nr:unnamed protein product [Moneuplotes crassus]